MATKKRKFNIKFCCCLCCFNVLLIKTAKPKIPLNPRSSPAQSPRRRVELKRNTKITKTEETGEKKEYDVSFEELVDGDLLGRGQFGTVKKMFHQPSGITFAVKVILIKKMLI